VKVLIVKTSSLGDVVHTLPALTDAVKALSEISFDWVVEEGFSEIPLWHPAVKKVIPVALRRWRKKPISTFLGAEWAMFKKTIQHTEYDCAIDAQGLIKSAFLMRYCSSPIHGFDKRSAREPLACFFYRHKHTVGWNQHAVERTRQLFSKSLGYALPESLGAFNLQLPSVERHLPEVVRCHQSKHALVFLHGTTWLEKHWPVEYWSELALMAEDEGFTVYLPWGNERERLRAEKIAKSGALLHVLPKLNLAGVAAVIAQAKGVVAVDSGLGHLTAALGIPAISLYGPTSPAKVGTYGKNQIHLTLSDGDATCTREVEPAIFKPLTPKIVWKNFVKLLHVSDKKRSSGINKV